MLHLYICSISKYREIVLNDIIEYHFHSTYYCLITYLLWMWKEQKILLCIMWEVINLNILIGKQEMRNNKRYIVMQNDKKVLFWMYKLWGSIYMETYFYLQSNVQKIVFYISNSHWNDKNRKWVNVCLIEHSCLYHLFSKMS